MARKHVQEISVAIFQSKMTYGALGFSHLLFIFMILRSKVKYVRKYLKQKENFKDEKGYELLLVGSSRERQKSFIGLKVVQKSPP